MKDYVYLFCCLGTSMLAFVYFAGMTAWDYYDHYRSKRKRKLQ